MKAPDWLKQTMISGCFTILGVLIGAVATPYLQRHVPRLVYLTEETLPLQGPSGTVAIYHVSIINDGNEVARELQCVARIPGAKIDRSEYSAPMSISSDVKKEVEGDLVRLRIPYLNPTDPQKPTEKIQLSILASSPNQLPKVASVDLRGVGIHGVGTTSEFDKHAEDAWNSGLVTGIFYTLLVVVFGSVIARDIYNAMQKKNKQQPESLTPPPGQQSGS